MNSLYRDVVRVLIFLLPTIISSKTILSAISMCVGSVKKFFERLRERDSFTWFVVLIIAVYLAFLAFSPVFRYGDDMRYFATAKTIAITGDLAPKYEMFGNTVFDGPPLMPYVLTLLYFLSLGNQHAWFWLAKIFSLLTFFGALYFLNKFADKYKLSNTQKIIALGLFSFFPASIFTSLSAMQDMAIAFFSIVLFWELLKERSNYAAIFALSGLLILVKATGFLVLFAAIATVLIMKGDGNRKIKLISAIVLGALILGGWWFLRNYEAYGSPLYSHSFDQKFELFPNEDLPIKIFYSYATAWGIPYAGSIVSKIGFNPAAANILMGIVALFFTPLIIFFSRNTLKFRKEFLLLFPLIAIFAIFSYVVEPINFGWIDSRYFLPALLFVSLIISRSVTSKRIKYFVAVFILFLVISGITNYILNKNLSETLGSFAALKEKYPDKNIVMLEKDWELRSMTNLYFNATLTPLQENPCIDYEKMGSLLYCVTDNLVVLREKYALLNK